MVPWQGFLRRRSTCQSSHPWQRVHDRPKYWYHHLDSSLANQWALLRILTGIQSMDHLEDRSDSKSTSALVPAPKSWGPRVHCPLWRQLEVGRCSSQCLRQFKPLSGSLYAFHVRGSWSSLESLQLGLFESDSQQPLWREEPSESNEFQGLPKSYSKLFIFWLKRLPWKMGCCNHE